MPYQTLIWLIFGGLLLLGLIVGLVGLRAAKRDKPSSTVWFLIAAGIIVIAAIMRLLTAIVRLQEALRIE